MGQSPRYDEFASFSVRVEPLVGKYVAVEPSVKSAARDMSASISPIIQNKDDSVESSFCYKLFEERYFDVGRMEELVCYVQSSDMNTEEIDILAWIIECVDNCFAYHWDVNDYFRIVNYTNVIESKWNAIWKRILVMAIMLSRVKQTPHTPSIDDA